VAEAPLSPGSWVRVHRIELTPDERAPALPPDTAACPFESWINGSLLDEATLGGRARVQTMAGRVVEGKVVMAAPGYTHSFGPPPMPLQRAGARARETLFTERTA
jgi:2-amino-4-ketopentanoate thiolase alpha subunit